MFAVFQLFIMILVAIFVISQIIVPALDSDLHFFWIFKEHIFKESNKERQNAEEDLSISKVKRKTRKIREEISKVDKD